ncbi:hypothetical protein Jiend_36240 [Micromonospora endophytica]|nr:thiamine phosphate synthase [Micromonospora endophytica]BCJ60202.1 hypothetical protein Jiend_36240 [Micromonospora endophytica]
MRWVVLRELDLPRAERLALAAELRAILAAAGGTLAVAGPDPLLDTGGTGCGPGGRRDSATGGSRDSCSGGGGNGGSGGGGKGAAAIVPPCPTVALHLPAAGPYPPPVADLVGRSCHDEAELRRLTTEDYVTLSPVYPTRSKPGYGPPLLPDGLARLIRLSPVPAVALGGIETPAQVRACVDAGAAAVAVLGAIMRAPDPEHTAATLTTAFHQATHPNPPTRPNPTAAAPEPSTRHVSTAATPEPSTRHVSTAATPEPPTRHVSTGMTPTGLRPTVPTEGSSLTARSGHGRPQPPTATPATTEEEK